MLEFPRDGQYVGRVVIIRFGFALVLVQRWSLMIPVVVQHDVVPAQIQTLPAPVPVSARPVSEHRVGHEPLAVDRVLPVSVASVIPLVGADAFGLGVRAGDSVGAEASVVQAPAGRGRGRGRGRCQRAVRGGAGANATHGDGPLTGGPAPYAAHARSLERFTPLPTHTGMKETGAGSHTHTLQHKHTSRSYMHRPPDLQSNRGLIKSESKDFFFLFIKESRKN